MGVSIPHRRRARPPPELRIYGYDETTLARLERDFHLADLSSPTRIALDFARKLSEVVDPDDRAAFERAVDKLTERSSKLAAEINKNRLLR